MAATEVTITPKVSKRRGKAKQEDLPEMEDHQRRIAEIEDLADTKDPGAGHVGKIYEADGWAPLGLTDEAWGYGWNSRNGRRDQRVSRKMRWVRTP